jgi:Tfp pilus assembly protein PilF
LFALPDSRVENNLGICAIHSGDLQKAEQHFRRALAMDANFQGAEKNLEQVLKQKSSGVQ